MKLCLATVSVLVPVLVPVLVSGAATAQSRISRLLTPVSVSPVSRISCLDSSTPPGSRRGAELSTFLAPPASLHHCNTAALWAINCFCFACLHSAAITALISQYCDTSHGVECGGQQASPLS